MSNSRWEVSSIATEIKFSGDTMQSTKSWNCKASLEVEEAEAMPHADQVINQELINDDPNFLEPLDSLALLEEATRAETGFLVFGSNDLRKHDGLEAKAPLSRSTCSLFFLFVHSEHESLANRTPRRRVAFPEAHKAL
ncbi:hypothetical protein UY3_02369 [Chelonia mydas]|uniref:Uncharacterized protein n=1 Tax=Chelonia mydas TaxID=8469 RepID=M7C780_CHEMY|nr:hypothetical protein UY3_02369 [Chelonia mydas]